ncbi:hypothetical protein [Phytomonospora endophytica]|uniref:Uncharacterized protein n=1 Tax=Phytomonospora endophytica TaxID=714109 RepID=A0A841FSG4_9ACTN|nr:hypothetical protein [Phytomonospora endophytica]MBB6038744.1 hypothetical protein [Phytomonospora endophytica]GIG68460.1 hypothetical protein Pen01_47550 [Phytomonospora endophytica]
MHPTQQSEPAPDAVWSRHGGRRHLLVLLLGVLLFAVLTALLVNAFATGDFADGGEKVIGGVLTVGCSLTLVMFIVAAVVMPRRRHRLPGVAIDAAGIWWLREERLRLVAWSQISAVGVGFLRPPKVSGPIRTRDNWAIEVFLRVPEPPSPYLSDWVVAEQPPRPGLPAERLRYVMFSGRDRHELRQAVARHAPESWIGEYERRWTRLGVFGK